MRTVLPTAVLTALLVTACGGSTDALGPVASGDEDVLSSCAPPGGSSTTTVVEATGDRPSPSTMEAALADNPDAQFLVEQFEQDGMEREDAVHALYGQVVGDRLLEDARTLPGFVSGAYASPEDGEPFRLAFSGELPDAFDPDAYELASYGLEVTTGAAGFDHDAFAVAFERADELGIRVLGGSGDETTGTATIEVIDATPEQVAAWEEAVAGSDSICIVRVAPTQSCDGAAPLEGDERPDVPYAPTDPDAEPTDAEMEEVTAGYLGLTLEQARARGQREGREVRVVVEDGVELARNDDLSYARVNLSACSGIVVEAWMDLQL